MLSGSTAALRGFRSYLPPLLVAPDPGVFSITGITSPFNPSPESECCNMNQREKRLFSQLTGRVPQQWHGEVYSRMKAGFPTNRVCAPLAEYLIADFTALHLVLIQENCSVAQRRQVLPVSHGSSGRRVQQTVQDVLNRAHGLPSLVRTLHELTADVPVFEVVNTSDREWRLDPSGFQSIVGFVDELGPRLLFNHKADTSNQQPMIAGLLGQDSLWILADPHLNPQFSETLKTIAGMEDGPRPLRCWTVGQFEKNADIIITAADLATDSKFASILDAERRLVIHETDAKSVAKKSLLKKINAHRDVSGRVAAFVTSPKTADYVFAKAKVEKKFVLSGTYRGAERAEAGRRAEALMKIEGEPCLLVATSSADTVSLDLDYLCSDLAGVPHMVQRLAQVNRSGQRVGEIHVFSHRKKRTSAEKSCAELLDKLPLNSDGSRDASLRALIECGFGYDGEPLYKITQRDLETQALTNGARPSNRKWVTAFRDSCVSMVFRDEIRAYASLLPYPWDRYSRKRIGRHYERLLNLAPINSDEIVSVPAHYVEKELVDLYDRYQEKIPAIVIQNGTGNAVMVSDVLRRRDFQLRNCTVVMPSDAGFLDVCGRFDASVLRRVEDVSARRYCKLLVTYRSEKWTAECLSDGGLTGVGSSPYAAVQHVLKHREGWRLAGIEQLGRVSDEHPFYLAVLSQVSEVVSYGGGRDQSLREHREMVQAWASRTSCRLRLDEFYSNQLVEFSRYHDAGKARDCWRHAVGSKDGEVLAKSGRRTFKGPLNGGYAHELGSLMEVRNTALEDLARHLIATHHGRGRPDFNNYQFDPGHSTTEVRAQVLEQALRYAQLQHEHGIWGLAWLETVARCADALASKYQLFPDDWGLA